MIRWAPRLWHGERYRRQNRPARIASVLTLLAAFVTVVLWTHSLLQFCGIAGGPDAEEEGDITFTLHGDRHLNIAPLTTSVPQSLLTLAKAPETSSHSSTAGHRETFKEQPAKDGDWVSTDAYPRTKLKLFLYSAFLDSRLDEPVVRVIGAYASVGGAHVSCRLEYANGDVTVVAARRKTINENWKLKYGAAFFTCPYLDDGSPPPSRVRLKETYELQWSPSIPVLPLKARVGEKTGRMAVCVKPLHYDYDRATWLAEFIEFHRIVGADHFFFYNRSIGSNVERLLQVYKEQGIVSSRPWNLDIKSQKEIRTEGLFASLNDCVYRCMHHFDYALVLDLDEFAVPRKDDTLLAMVSRINKDSAPRTITSFVLLNSFFYLYWENDTAAYGFPPETGPAEIPYLLTQYKTRRSKKVFRVGSRSKYIVRPGHGSRGRHAMHRVSPEDALLHHYRICEFGGFDCVRQPSLVDRSALRFNSSLLERVNRVCAQAFPHLGGRCPRAPGLGNPW
ncbi:hypothetical protein HPB48_000372 [Haemaphysalis longicornis]|uniref:Glycosyltransferase family 92 protein n=1 Tax=Haemaphysalis longicornis TaxID=44386 RepID=A0A9J6G8S7_HAELO|nr:hypothetical protein HPB48_000372 [Haemaphysalis longicornis]